VCAKRTSQKSNAFVDTPNTDVPADRQKPAVQFEESLNIHASHTVSNDGEGKGLGQHKMSQKRHREDRPEAALSETEDCRGQIEGADMQYAPFTQLESLALAIGIAKCHSISSPHSADSMY